MKESGPIITPLLGGDSLVKESLQESNRTDTLVAKVAIIENNIEFHYITISIESQPTWE